MGTFLTFLGAYFQPLEPPVNFLENGKILWNPETTPLELENDTSGKRYFHFPDHHFNSGQGRVNSGQGSAYSGIDHVHSGQGRDDSGHDQFQIIFLTFQH